MCMYNNGEGGPTGEAEVFDWLQTLAENGHVTAQFQLGNKYLSGSGAPKDRIAAYAWLGVAAAGGFQRARAPRDRIGARLYPAELKQARALARRLWTRHGRGREGE